MSDFKPAPKPSRIENRKTIDWVARERDGVCMWGLKHGIRLQKVCSAGLDPHHIQSKGSGGDDVPRNLITLCRHHHRMAQEHKIAPGALQEVLTFYYGYEYEE